MNAQEHPKFSTPSVDSLWWRAKINKDDVRWVRQHLGRFMEGVTAFKLIPKSEFLIESGIESDWSGRVRFVEVTTVRLLAQELAGLWPGWPDGMDLMDVMDARQVS